DHADASLEVFAHADDAAAADVDAGRTHVAERVEPILIGARGDDRAIVLGRGVEVVVVIVEAGCLEAQRLLRREHAERGAGLEPERPDARDHRADLVKIAVLWFAPGRAHAEAAGAGVLRRPRLRQHGVERHQLFRLHAGVVTRALRAI